MRDDMGVPELISFRNSSVSINRYLGLYRGEFMSVIKSFAFSFSRRTKLRRGFNQLYNFLYFADISCEPDNNVFTWSDNFRLAPWAFLPEINLLVTLSLWAVATSRILHDPDSTLPDWLFINLRKFLKRIIVKLWPIKCSWSTTTNILFSIFGAWTLAESLPRSVFKVHQSKSSVNPVQQSATPLESTA